MRSRILFFLACGMFSFVTMALSEEARWAGRYEGYLEQSRTTLTIEEEAGRISGKIVDDTGYTYLIEAGITGAEARGQLQDPAAGGTMELEARLDGDAMQMNLYRNLFGLRMAEIQIAYQRAGEGGEIAPAAPAATGAVPVDLDARLVGTWRYSTSYVSGDFSVASEYTLIARADGTYLYGDGRVAGGGNAGSFDSGGGAGYTAGQWKTANRQIFLNEGYGWQYYANYACDGARMMLTFQNGNKQVWQRID